MTLEEMLKEELPLNRKEQFYTGTVFPYKTIQEEKHQSGLEPLIVDYPTKSKYLL